MEQSAWCLRAFNNRWAQTGRFRFSSNFSICVSDLRLKLCGSPDVWSACWGCPGYSSEGSPCWESRAMTTKLADKPRVSSFQTLVPTGSPSHVGDITVYVYGINQSSLATLLFFLFFILFSRSGELRTQKLKSHLVRTQSLNVLPLKSGVGQYIAIHVMLTARNFFLAYFYPSGPFTCIFFQNLSQFFPVLAVANTGSCVGPQNEIGHSVGCRFPCWVPAEY